MYGGGESLATYLIKEGYGLPWDGSSKRPAFNLKGEYPVREDSPSLP